MNREETIKQIAKMIASGETPKEVYDKYLSECPIGFMSEKDLINYLLSKSKIEELNCDYVVPKTPATENEAYIMACLLAHEQKINEIIKG